MGREQLQGTPWHEEQMHRTCKDGSTNCIFNSKGKCAFVSCRFYDEPCKGKGVCIDFESRAGTPKVYSEKTIIIKQNPQNSKETGKQGIPSLKTVKVKMYNEKEALPVMNEEMDLKDEINDENESKAEKFKRLSKDRVNKVVKSIETLENLANKNQYDYSDEQVEKMFGFIEEALAQAKDSFVKKKSGQKFDW